MITVYFDGECKLCNRAVDFIVKRGDPDRIKLASLQGQHAAKNLDFNQLPDSIIVTEQAKLFMKSEALIRIATSIGGVYTIIARIGEIVPKQFLDKIYDFIAANRFKVFGKTDSCRTPTKEERQFFLE